MGVELTESVPVPGVDLLVGARDQDDGKLRVGVTLGLRSSGGPSALVIPSITEVFGGKGIKASPVYITRPIILEGAKLARYLDRQSAKDAPKQGSDEDKARIAAKTAATNAETAANTAEGLATTAEDEAKADPAKKAAADTARQEANAKRKVADDAQDKHTALTSHVPPIARRLLNSTTASCDAFYVQKDGPLLMSFLVNFHDGVIGALTGDPDLSELFDVTGVSVRVLRCSKDSLPTLERYVAELTGREVVETNGKDDSDEAESS